MRPPGIEYLFLDLQAANCGRLQYMEGGNARAEVLRERDVGYFLRKHIGQPKYEDILLHVDLSMCKALYDWIAAFWKGETVRKDGTIFVVDQQMELKSQREFFNAVISEVTIPPLDGGSKDAASMTLRLTPEYARFKRASGKFGFSVGLGHAKQKQWISANFRLEIDGLDCTRVTKVDAFTVKRVPLAEGLGETHDASQETGKVDFPELSIAMVECWSCQPWLDWHDDFVIKGNSGEGQEKNGSLTFLAPDAQTELARVNFFNLGIFSLAPEKLTLRTDQIHKLVAKLYCERMELVYPASLTPSP